MAMLHGASPRFLGGKAVLETAAGLLICDVNDAGQITVDMGPPRLNLGGDPAGARLRHDVIADQGRAGSMFHGNPHATFLTGWWRPRQLAPFLNVILFFRNAPILVLPKSRPATKMRLRVWSGARG